jgi:PKD domain/Putative Ig domain/FlgD Ig-like domain
MRALISVLFCALAISGTAATAQAQYMYLDSNGDGIPSNLDRLSFNGAPTTVDVWLRTNVNRNGSSASCNSDGAVPLDINHYAVNLEAVGGSVMYTNFINRQSGPWPHTVGEMNADGVHYRNGFGGSFLPPGTYHLATLTITGVTGSPGIRIVDRIPGSLDFTAFGTHCFGNGFDEVYKLDGPNTQALQGAGDWFDWEGLGAAGGNAPPVLNPIGNRFGFVGCPLTFTATASDPDAGQTLTFSLGPGSFPPPGPTIGASTGAFSWTASATGTFPVTVVVTDDAVPAQSDSETILITIGSGPSNTPPVLAPIGNRTVQQGSPLTITATATDPDAGQILTFSLDSGAPAGAAINPTTGVFTWTPSSEGILPITIRVTDDGGPCGVPLSDSETIQVEVIQGNAPPVLAAIGNKTVDEGSLLTFTATAISATGAPIVFTLGAGAPPGASIGFSNGVFQWTPTEAQGPGVYAITVIATEAAAQNLSDSELIQVTVREVNTAPVLAPIGNKSGSIGVPTTFTATASDTDIPAQTLTFSLGAGPPGATIDASTGAFSWTPNACGTFLVTVVVTDNGPPARSDSETISIVLGGCSGASPVLDAIGNKTVDEGSLLGFTATATDPDAGQTITFSLGAGAPAGATITAGGNFTWTPTEAQGPGSFPITVYVTDSGVPSLVDSEEITVTVREVNAAPVIQAIGTRTVLEGQFLIVSIPATDSDLPPNTLTCSLGPGSPPGASVNSTTCTFFWFPTECQGPGTYTGSVCVTDNGTPPLSSCAAFQIVVLEANIAPVLAAIGNKTVEEGTLLTFIATATDADCPGQTVTFSLAPGAPLGAAITPSGVFTWTPSEDQGPGTHSITVVASDDQAPRLSDTETIQVTVLEVNNAPTADADGPYTGLLNVPVPFDGTGSTDPEGDALTYTWDFGDGNTGAGATTSHLYSIPGVYGVTLTVNDGVLSDEDGTTATIIDEFSTVVFTVGGNKTIRLGSGKPQTCIQIEPFQGSYNVSDVDLSSVRMRFASLEIPAIADKTAVGDDKNQNGVTEITACFSKEDLRVLFAGQGTGDYEVALTGSLVTGGSFRGTMTIHVVNSGNAVSSSVSPNPLNPKATLTFSTSKSGFVRVQMFDVRGRLIRTLLDQTSVSAGHHDVEIDGADAGGNRLASGIYYIHVRTSDGTARSVVTILK